MEEEIPQGKNWQALWNSPIYRKASEFSETLWKEWNLGDLVSGNGKKRLQILARCRDLFYEKPSDYDFSLAVGLVHEAVSMLAFGEQITREGFAFGLPLMRLPDEKDGPYRFLRAVTADILVHFPGDMQEFLGAGSILDEEFSVRWLYILHSGIARSAGRCLQYLNIHVPVELPARYLPAFPPISVPPR